jgi:hypothetical protein
MRILRTAGKGKKSYVPVIVVPCSLDFVLGFTRKSAGKLSRQSLKKRNARMRGTRRHEDKRIRDHKIRR